MSEEAPVATPAEAPAADPPKRKKDKYRRDKPWDNDPTIDKWKIEKFTEEDNPHGGPVIESSFAVLFP